jgi:diacylglycerol kinase family enzyme
MVFNLPRYGGGLQIEPEARDDDGLLDVILFRKGSLLSGLRYLTEIWLRRHLENSSVIRMLATSVRIESESRVPFQLDGDYAGRLPLKVETRPRSVSLLMPPE